MTSNGHKHRIVREKLGQVDGFNKSYAFVFSDDINKWMKTKIKEINSARPKKKGRVNN